MSDDKLAELQSALQRRAAMLLWTALLCPPVRSAMTVLGAAGLQYAKRRGEEVDPYERYVFPEELWEPSWHFTRHWHRFQNAWHWYQVLLAKKEKKPLPKFEHFGLTNVGHVAWM